MLFGNQIVNIFVEGRSIADRRVADKVERRAEGEIGRVEQIEEAANEAALLNLRLVAILYCVLKIGRLYRR